MNGLYEVSTPSGMNASSGNDLLRAVNLKPSWFKISNK